jgi:hypothetical protein
MAPVNREILKIVKAEEVCFKPKKTEILTISVFYCLVAPAGIEPASSESESEILSIEIRSRMLQSAAKIRKACYLKNISFKNHRSQKP